MNPSHAWQSVIGQLQMEMPKATFDTWVRDAQFLSFNDNTFTIGLKNAYARDWVENRLTSTISRTLTGIMNHTVDLNFIVSQQDISASSSAPAPVDRIDSVAEDIQNPSLAPKYTFENFVVGANNRLAHAASIAVAENPARAYNPLFLYGGVGLGKTHLLHAIGNACALNGARVLYVSSEEFTNDLINAIRSHTTQAFRDKYRAIDVLLIDDIQFIAGKESTQEEFFHTFNALYESHKQIVVTSDKFPKEIPGLEDRLRSRFEWGLIADIQSPDIETKQAILKMKAEQNSINLPEDVALFLANSVCSNVRELEGYLIRIGAYASLTSTPLNLDMAREVLKDILIEKNKELTVDEILKKVCSHFNVKISDVKSSRRHKAIVLPRQIAMYLSRQLTSSSYPEIGEKFGGKDHSTIIHAINKIEKLLEEDYNLRNTLESLKKLLTT